MGLITKKHPAIVFIELRYLFLSLMIETLDLMGMHMH